MKNGYVRVGKLTEKEEKYSLLYKNRGDQGDKIIESNMKYKLFDSHYEAMQFIKENNIRLEK